MPQAIAQTVHALAVIRLEYLATVVHVRYIGNGFVTETVGPQRRCARLGVQGAIKALGKRQLLGIGKRLIAKHQHAVLIHAGAQLFQRDAIVHLA